MTYTLALALAVSSADSLTVARHADHLSGIF